MCWLAHGVASSHFSAEQIQAPPMAPTRLVEFLRGWGKLQRSCLRAPGNTLLHLHRQGHKEQCSWNCRIHFLIDMMNTNAPHDPLRVHPSAAAHLVDLVSWYVVLCCQLNYG
jgi:hypothetical protein